MPADPIILLRTHYLDAAVHRFIEALKADTGLTVVIAADEGWDRLDPVPLIPKVALSPQRYSALGLHCPPDVMWRCGDYALYAAIEEIGPVSQLWMIEPDVRIHAGSMAGFFEFFAGHPEVDFLSCGYAAANASWGWYPAMAPHAAAVFKCLFPLTRMSGRAVDFLLERRRALSRLPAAEAFWPNDESFCATELTNAGFHCRDFNSFGPTFYTNESFSFLNALALSRFETLPHDGLIHHPVLAGARFRRKLLSRLLEARAADLPAEQLAALFGPALMADLEAECGAEVAAQFAVEAGLAAPA
jgi:hypothetical protein